MALNKQKYFSEIYSLFCKVYKALDLNQRQIADHIKLPQSNIHRFAKIGVPFKHCIVLSKLLNNIIPTHILRPDIYNKSFDYSDKDIQDAKNIITNRLEEWEHGKKV